MQPSRLLAQTVSGIADPFDSLRYRPESALPATDCAGGKCQATPSTSYCNSRNGPSRPRPRRESVLRTSCRSLPAAGSLRSPVRCPFKARQSHTARHPPGPRSTRFARSAPYVTGRLTAATHKPSHTPGSCETASNIGHQETHAPTTSGKGPSCPARWGSKGINTYTTAGSG